MLFRPSKLPDSVRIRPPLYDPSFPYIVFWSQKSGCTTVVKWFFAQLGLLDEALAYSNWIHDYEGQVFKKRKFYKREVAEALRSGTHKAVKVVRDPMARAPSSFLVLAERGAILERRHHWAQDHWTLVNDWLAERGRPVEPGLTFLDHLEMVREFEAKEAHSINQHISPQYVAGEEEFLNEVIPIERFADWATGIAGTDGIKDVDMNALGESRHHHQVTERRTKMFAENAETIPIERGAFANGKFPSSKVFINERTQPIIRDTYKVDFDNYGHLYGH
ncbi:sulfotransferase family 2 domain-containing protein [Acuticoccus sediminis]|nr:sulfotransferase family 2 domain-containing protein [Acuticoccus sediminis]